MTGVTRASAETQPERMGQSTWVKKVTSSHAIQISRKDTGQDSVHGAYASQSNPSKVVIGVMRSERAVCNSASVVAAGNAVEQMRHGVDVLTSPLAGHAAVAVLARQAMAKMTRARTTVVVARLR